MSHRLSLEARRVADRARNGDPYWPAQATLLAAAALNLAVTEQVSVGPKWIVSGVEVAAVIVYVAATPARATRSQPAVRRFVLGFIGLIFLTYAASLGLLIHYLVGGGQADGEPLIASGGVLWLTNVLLFGVLYWELDRGGPVLRFRHPENLPDLSFPQMQNPELAPEAWRPGFVDYLYTSLTAATAFSPTDTMPLTHSAKVVMAIQSTTAYVTIGLIVARAVNIIG